MVRDVEVRNDLPESNDDQHSSQHPSRPKSDVDSAFLSELLGLSASKSLLKLRLICKAEQFLDPAVLRALRPGVYEWLEDALLELKASALMKRDAMLGILMACTALGEITSSHIPIFLKGMDPVKCQELVALYQSNLTALYDDDEVCRWLAQHLGLLNEPTLRLAKHLCDKHVSNAYDILEIHRVCTLPESLDTFTTVCRMILATDCKSWITEGLKHCPQQEQVDPEALAEVLICISQVNQRDFLAIHKAMIVKQPVSSWLKIITQLNQNKSELNTDALQWSDVVSELVKLKNGVDMARLNDLCKDPKSRSVLVLGQVKLRPNEM